MLIDIHISVDCDPIHRVHIYTFFLYLIVFGRVIESHIVSSCRILLNGLLLNGCVLSVLKQLRVYLCCEQLLRGLFPADTSQKRERSL